MALDQNAKYPVGTSPATAAYPEGSAVNSTAPGALDGYPLEKDQINDRFGLEQALLRAGGQAASGIPDTALVSQYMQMIVELASGRAFNYDDSGAANVYVLDVQANQQAPQTLFDGLEFNFIPANTNTGASTANPVALGVLNIRISGGVTDPVAGQIVAGKPETLVYRVAPSAHLELKGAPFVSAEQTITVSGLLTIAHGLAAKPRTYLGFLICKTAEGGYSIGDEIPMPLGFTSTSVLNDFGVSVVPDVTNLNVRYGSNAQVFILNNKTTGTGFGITAANWKFILRAQE